jgi:hypothetical protein
MNGEFIRICREIVEGVVLSIFVERLRITTKISVQTASNLDEIRIRYLTAIALCLASC